MERGAKSEENQTEAATGPLDVDAEVKMPAQEAEASTQEYIIGKAWLKNTHCSIFLLFLFDIFLMFLG